MLKLRGHASPCGGSTQQRIGLLKALKKASLSHALRRSWVNRDKVGPQCVTERSTHLLGNALEQPTPTLLCALVCHLGQFDRVGWLVRTHSSVGVG